MIKAHVVKFALSAAFTFLILIGIDVFFYGRGATDQLGINLGLAVVINGLFEMWDVYKTRKLQRNKEGGSDASE